MTSLMINTEHTIEGVAVILGIMANALSWFSLKPSPVMVS
jgi:hypothetical protein